MNHIKVVIEMNENPDGTYNTQVTGPEDLLLVLKTLNASSRRVIGEMEKQKKEAEEAEKKKQRGILVVGPGGMSPMKS